MPETLLCTQDFAGAEQFYAKQLYNIAHIAKFSSNEGTLQTICNNSLNAWKYVIARHPRMRCFIDDINIPIGKSNASNIFPFQGRIVGRIYKDLTPQEINTSIQITQAESPLDWKTLVASKTNHYPNYREVPPFSLVILKPAPSEVQNSFQLLLFHPQHVSDGFSGFRIIHDFIFQCMEPTGIPDPLPILPPLIYRWFGYKLKPAKSPTSIQELSFFSRTYRYAHELLLGALYNTLMKEFRDLKPSLPIDSRKYEVMKPPYNTIVPTSYLYASGTANALVSAKSACRSNGVTLNGSIISAAAISFYLTKIRAKTNDADVSTVKFGCDIDYNRRKAGRLGGEPMGDDHVGFNISYGSMTHFKQGVKVATKFWDNARLNKSVADKTMLSLDAKVYSMAAEWASENVLSPMAAGDLPEDFLKQGFVGDLNLSNLGMCFYRT